MDPANPVVTLCAEGMRAEAEARWADARQLFQQAWDAHTDDYGAWVAAHYLARHQQTPEEALLWNQRAVEHADAVGDERVTGFYASLYLNLGKLFEDLGVVAEARRCYDLAAGHLAAVPVGPYRDLVAGGVESGRKRASGRNGDR